MCIRDRITTASGHSSAIWIEVSSIIDESKLLSSFMGVGTHTKIKLGFIFDKSCMVVPYLGSINILFVELFNPFSVAFPTKPWPTIPTLILIMLNLP